MPFTVYFKSSSQIYGLFLRTEGKNIVFLILKAIGDCLFLNTYLKYKDHNLLSIHINRLFLVYM